MLGQVDPTLASRPRAQHVPPPARPHHRPASEPTRASKQRAASAAAPTYHAAGRLLLPSSRGPPAVTHSTRCRRPDPTAVLPASPCGTPHAVRDPAPPLSLAVLPAGWPSSPAGAPPSHAREQQLLHGFHGHGVRRKMDLLKSRPTTRCLGGSESMTLHEVAMGSLVLGTRTRPRRRRKDGSHVLQQKSMTSRRLKTRAKESFHPSSLSANLRND